MKISMLTIIAMSLLVTFPASAGRDDSDELKILKAKLAIAQAEAAKAKAEAEKAKADAVKAKEVSSKSRIVELDGATLQRDVDNIMDAENLLQKEIGGLDFAADLLDANVLVDYKPTIQNKTDDSVTLRYLFESSYSKEKYYKIFLPRITKVMNQICAKKLNDRAVQCAVVSVEKNPVQARNVYCDGYEIKESEKVKDVSVPARCLMMNVQNYGWKNRNKNSVSVVYQISKSTILCREWLLSERLKVVLDNMLIDMCKKNAIIECVLKLHDQNGSIICVGTTQIGINALYESRRGSQGKRDSNSYGESAEFFPMVMQDYRMDELSKDGEDACARMWHSDKLGGTFYAKCDRYVGYIDITIDREMLSKIKTAEISLSCHEEN